MGDEMRPAVNAFAGRVGGNQEFILDRNDPDNRSLLEQNPDAAPMIPLRQLFDLRGLWNVLLWKQAFAEGMGTLILVYATGYMATSPNIHTPPPSPTSGPFSTTSFLGALIGGITSTIFLTIAILTFGPITGGHLNPFITIATFVIRLTSLPRAILYIGFQLVGASLAGLLIRASWGSRDFKVGGCFLFEAQGATVGSAFVTEFVGSLSLIILVFGVALDPRNKAVLGPVLGPFLVGSTLGVLSFGLSFGKEGYGGPSMNPARCFGAYVGSRFPGWHWVHWVGPIAAAVAHAIMYAAVPPWELRGQIEEVETREGKVGMTPTVGSSTLGDGHTHAVVPRPKGIQDGGSDAGRGEEV
ncbi:uncharacterized protein HMPREF1541_08081 [Cyphellophora europaea CBS 101466]|uniref:Aquaporin n=1 Tax=Cyphellophora europaea (strain CBS 101466) TaxID=1220924 RepID=W2RKS8_CYPE1|nr:uncharacterized protein HMPREF1541_08081 [Cyphellophora europaea CBS 101466]ETN37091.1 hypothetical protein HMPREF1541_08081 [Cyphellophora europaea CBS 101466]